MVNYLSFCRLFFKKFSSCRAIHLLFFIFLSSASLAQSKWEAEPSFFHYTDQHGLPSLTVYDIIQDTKGYIWLATDAGVSRFDGHEFQNYSLKEGLPDNEIIGLYEDPEGRIWFASVSGKLSYYFEGKIFNKDAPYLSQPNLEGPIISIRMFNSKIWVGTTKGKFYSLYKDSITVYSHITPGTIYDFWSFSNDTFGIVGAGGLFLVDKNKKIVTPFWRKNEEMRLIRLKEDSILYKRASSFIVVTKNGEHHFPIKNETLFYRNVNHITTSATGNIWIGTTNGARLYEKREDHFILTKHYLENKIVTKAIEDREGNLWFATKDKGLFFLSAYTAFYSVDKLQNKWITKIKKDKTGRIWFAASGEDYLYHLNNNQLYSLPLHKGITNKVIYSLSFLDENEVYIGSNKGFFKLKDFKIEKILPELDVKSVRIDSKKNIWIGTPYGIAKYDENLNFSDSLKIGRVLSLSLDSDDNIWFGKDDGLYKFAANTISKIKGINQRIIKILPAGGNGFWLATQGAGIIHYDGSKTTTIGEKQGLVNNICNDIRIDKKNIIWVATNEGVSKVGIDGSEPKNYTITNFTSSDGLVSDKVNSLCIKNDTVWIATNTGVVFFSPSAGNKKAVPPLIHIKGVQVSGIDTTTGDTLALPYSMNDLSIQLSGISFGSNGKLFYKYKLKGADGQWHYKKNSQITYQSLAPGNYTFLAHVKSSSGTWSKKPAVLYISIAKPFWQTWWFLAAMAILILGACFALFRLTVFVKHRRLFDELTYAIYKRLKKKRYIYLKTEDHITRIDPEEILYVKAAREYIEVYTPHQKYVALSSLKKFEEQIPWAKDFIRVHRSYIVKKDRIDKIKNNVVVISGTEVPIGKNYKSSIKEMYMTPPPELK